MIKMKCKIDGKRTVVLDSCGISKIKDGDIFSIKNEDVIQPEIQFLISKNILTVIEEIKDPLVIETKDYIRPSFVVFKCNLSEKRKLTLDSIKGTVQGGQKIEIKTADITNEDIAYAIRNNYIKAIQDTTEIAEKNEIKPIIEAKVDSTATISKETASDILKEAEKIVEDVSIEEVTEKVEKEDVPKFRVNENVDNVLKELGEEIVKLNTTRPKKTESNKETSTKKTSTRKKTTKRKSTVKKNNVETASKEIIDATT